MKKEFKAPPPFERKVKQDNSWGFSQYLSRRVAALMRFEKEAGVSRNQWNAAFYLRHLIIPFRENPAILEQDIHWKEAYHQIKEANTKRLDVVFPPLSELSPEVRAVVNEPMREDARNSLELPSMEDAAMQCFESLVLPLVQILSRHAESKEEARQSKAEALAFFGSVIDECNRKNLKITPKEERGLDLIRDAFALCKKLDRPPTKAEVMDLPGWDNPQLSSATWTRFLSQAGLDGLEQGRGFY